MKKATMYISNDGMWSAPKAECCELEQNAKSGVGDTVLWETHRSINIEMQRMKSASSPYARTLPMLQAGLLHYKNAYIYAKKHRAKASKAKRFAELAVLQYKYYDAKFQLAQGIELYRKRKARLRELGKRLGFHGACPAGEEVCDGK